MFWLRLDKFRHKYNQAQSTNYPRYEKLSKFEQSTAVFISLRYLSTSEVLILNLLPGVFLLTFPQDHLKPERGYHCRQHFRNGRIPDVNKHWHLRRYLAPSQAKLTVTGTVEAWKSPRK